LPTVKSLFRFHVAGGGRVASRNAIATICAIIIVLGSAPDPLVWLKFLALGVAGAGHDSGPLIGLTLIALALSFEAVPRLTLGLGGWTRSLPATAVQHRRGVTYGLPIIQLPLVTSALLAAVLTSLVFRVPLAWPKLLGVPIALVAAGAAAVPAQRGFIAIPAFTASALLAAYGRWTTLAASVALFAVGELLAGGIRFPARRRAVAAPAAPGTMRMFRFTWRAVGWRLLAPLPMPALALAAAWFYSRNNELGPADTAFVARLWSIIAVSLYIGAVGDIIVSRRPSWPWARSLPWSSAARAVDNAIAVGVPAVPIALLASVVDLRTTVIALAAVLPFAALASALLHGARRRLTRVSGRMLVTGALVATAVAFHPWLILVALAATPLLLRASAWRDRREIVTGWKELHHDAAGDSLAWSGR
jgi:hypothetical protein